MTAGSQPELSAGALLELWSNSSVASERAAALVIKTVKAFPQRNHVPLIIADLLLCEIDEIACARSGVRLTDVAELTSQLPEPALSAKLINAAHSEAGSDLRIPARVAAGFVARCGFLSLEHIRSATVFYAGSEGVAVPATLERPILLPKIPNFCEDVRYLDGVPDLEALLMTETEVRFGVSSSIQEAAEAARFEPPPMAHVA
jgi:hypothetical protein